ncbi:Cytidylyltransferase domain-containing protein [Paraphaeosphaeria minitans]|uniref:Cytidylyltransferase domain-containing protein n=1 Tax=Paraphaeosphaeria minitans TaxID=565426 RepID=A0A9P6G4M7_9PLEO|nr:Cytidylyltransferase domain-containing protein [Paraphaeosphaeria minitans]
MDFKTADLERYIASCHSTQYQRFGITDRVFDQGMTHVRPRLNSDRTNRTILFPGSFNPPHCGHETLLRRAFENSQDIDVIAAIVLLLDDDDVEAKCRHLGQRFTLAKEDRVRLWRGYGPHDWRWVHDSSERDFRRRLTDVITGDGFDPKFVVLAGPDYIKRDSRPPCNSWGCEETMVSDASRPADFTTRRHALEQLTDSELTQALDPNYFEDLIAFVRSENEKEVKAVRVCLRRGSTKGTIRFIPSKDQADAVSSNRVRQIIESGMRETLRENLEPFALNPDILIDIIHTRERNALSDPHGRFDTGS